MRVLIAGSGGVGGYLGAKFAQSGASVTLLARGEHLKAIQESGLTIIDNNQKFTIDSIEAVDDSSNCGTFDLIIISVKSTSFRDILEKLSPNIDSHTAILPILNGVDFDLEIAKRYPNSRVLNGCIYIISNIKSPGVVRKRGEVFKLCWGSDNFDIDEFQDIKSLFDKSLPRHEYGSDIRLKQWRKFLFISPMAGLSSLYDIPMDRVYSEHRDELEEFMREIVSLANSRGINLTNRDIESQLKQASKVIKGAKTSMQLDIERGKESEIDSLIGFVAKSGEYPIAKRVYNKIRNEQLAMRSE